jgi:hypothetical protein
MLLFFGCLVSDCHIKSLCEISTVANGLVSNMCLMQATVFGIAWTLCLPLSTISTDDNLRRPIDGLLRYMVIDRDH